MDEILLNEVNMLAILTPSTYANDVLRNPDEVNVMRFINWYNG